MTDSKRPTEAGRGRRQPGTGACLPSHGLGPSPGRGRRLEGGQASSPPARPPRGPEPQVQGEGGPERAARGAGRGAGPRSSAAAPASAPSAATMSRSRSDPNVSSPPPYLPRATSEDARARSQVGNDRVGQPGEGSASTAWRSGTRAVPRSGSASARPARKARATGRIPAGRPAARRRALGQVPRRASAAAVLRAAAPPRGSRDGRTSSSALYLLRSHSSPRTLRSCGLIGAGVQELLAGSVALGATGEPGQGLERPGELRDQRVQVRRQMLEPGDQFGRDLTGDGRRRRRPSAPPSAPADAAEPAAEPAGDERRDLARSSKNSHQSSNSRSTPLIREEGRVERLDARRAAVRGRRGTPPPTRSPSDAATAASSPVSSRGIRGSGSRPASAAGAPPGAGASRPRRGTGRPRRPISSYRASSSKRGRGPVGLQEGIAAGVEELQRLGDEFDLADAARPELQVALQRAAAPTTPARCGDFIAATSARSESGGRRG